MTTYLVDEVTATPARGTKSVWSAYFTSGDINQNDVRQCVLIHLPRGIRLGLAALTGYQSMGSSGTATFWFMTVPKKYAGAVLDKDGDTDYVVTWIRNNLTGYGDLCAVPVPFGTVYYCDLSAFDNIPLEDCVLFVQCDNVGDNSGVDTVWCTISFKQIHG